VQNALVRDGIDLALNCAVTGVSQTSEGKVVHYDCPGQEGQQIVVDEILVSTGRKPNVEGLNLEAAGVEYDQERGVLVNDLLRTSNPRIYSAGDVSLQHKFTHTAGAAALVALANALFPLRVKMSSLIIPWTTYTDPEIAHVGLYERDADKQGIAVQTFVQPFSEVDRAITDSEEDGFVKIHVKEGTDKIIGATIVSRHAGEMISEITLAMAGNIGLKKLANIIHPYPTQAEAIRMVGDAYNKTRLTPRVKSLLSRWMAWTR
jgi:pyruvate/2-oxoglutarate dehydrogenase complex dihydrolipoamide dehydrogenase (E3) component